MIRRLVFGLLVGRPQSVRLELSINLSVGRKWICLYTRTNSIFSCLFYRYIPLISLIWAIFLLFSRDQHLCLEVIQLVFFFGLNFIILTSGQAVRFINLILITWVTAEYKNNNSFAVEWNKGGSPDEKAWTPWSWWCKNKVGLYNCGDGGAGKLCVSRVRIFFIVK